MKKLMIIAGCIFFLSCSNNPGESGVVNDGFDGAGDTNGGLPDTPQIHRSPGVDTTAEDHRVDKQQRDTTQKR